MKHQKAIPAKLVFHIYKKQHSHLIKVIVQLIAGDFSVEYYHVSITKPPMGSIREHASCGRGKSNYTGNGASYRTEADAYT